MTTILKRSSLLALCLAALTATAGSQAAEPNVHAGRARTYEALDSKSLEDTSPSDAIKSIRFPNIAPTAIWKLLEHGEKVECLSCVPIVAKRLYDDHPKTREISAWWLRRRIFGVFGKGEIYSQVIDTLNNPAASEKVRAYAANAVGEFLSPAGVRHVARAAVQDPSPRVREAAVSALLRLNHEGPELELGKALADSDENVRLAAMKAAISINVFSSVSEVVKRIDDPSARVRRRAAEALGSMRAVDAVVGLAALANGDSSAEVRQAAIWALGQIGAPAGRPAVEAALSDVSSSVRDAARIALRRL
jgi:hypothetical protein